MAARKSKALTMSWQDQLMSLRNDGIAPKSKEKVASNSYISTKGAKFTVDGKKLGTEFEGVVVNFVTERTYYDTPYTEGEISVPACYAIDSDPDNCAPDDTVANRQADSCANCEMSKWVDGEPPECTERRRLAVLVNIGDKPTLKTLSLPSTSIKNWRNFYNHISQQGFETFQCGVNIHFDEESTAAYPPIDFEMTHEIKTDKELKALVGMLPEANEMLKQGYDSTLYTGGKTKKKATKKKASKKKGRKSKFSE